MKENLHLAFFALHPEWHHKIFQCMNPDQKTLYIRLGLQSYIRSISKRISEIMALVGDTIIEMGKVRKLINSNISDCERCIREKKAYVLPDVIHIYRILAYTESSIALLKSTVDLLFQYSIIVEKNILGKNSINKSIIKKEMASAGISLTWLANLDNIRDDILHQYASWLILTLENGAVGIKLELPKVPKTSREKKKYGEEYLDILEINRIFQGFSEFYDKALEFLIAHIREANERGRGSQAV